MGDFGLVVILLILIIAGGFGYALMSKDFEQNDPIIGISDKVYWNLRSPMNIKFKDDSGIKFVRISINDGKNDLNLLNQIIQNPSTELDVNLTFPKTGFLHKRYL